MTIDFTALTASVGAGFRDIRACLVVSRDGLPLGAYPKNEEARALTVWTRIAALGDTDRGFVAGSQELWAFCRLGPYRALAVAAPTAVPGVVLDRLDSMLEMAEEARREGLVVQEPPIHLPESEQTAARDTGTPRPEPAQAGQAAQAEQAEQAEQTGGPRLFGSLPPNDEDADPEGFVSGESTPRVVFDQAPEREKWDEDNVLLAREFSALVADDREER